MLHRFCCVEDTKAADDRFRGISEIENIFEGEFFEASSAESRELGAGQGPRHLAFGIGRLAASGDDEEKAAGTEEFRNFFDRPRTESGRQNLERIRLKYKMESAAPSGRRVENVGGEVFNIGSGKAFATTANGSFRDVESRGLESPSGELLGIVAQATADCQRRFSSGWQRMRVPEIKQARIGAEIGPRNNALPRFAFLVKLLEPADRVALAIEFRG